ncbi:hypothetical protein Dsin_008538 [Dipteronia sinensis]|uniref:DUF8040 domain-containing protein n=1 Tax=Dipteronia sinensis TaxID=43782 RepID=A0AAE0EAS0_9ROSI|nr:hypothetical protein Dsin_008538 [Dipteronia sinensis]
MASHDSDDDCEHDDIVDDLNFLQVMQIGVRLYVDHFLKHIYKVPCRTSSHTRYVFVIEVVKGYKDRCHQQFRMEKHVFLKLCKLLSESYCLKRAKNISLVETVAMFLITLGLGLGNRMVQERFQHSGETVSRWFSIVLDDVCRMAVDFLKPSDPTFRRVPTKIKDDNHYGHILKIV